METEKIIKILEKSMWQNCPQCNGDPSCDCLVMSAYDYNNDITKIIEAIR